VVIGVLSIVTVIVVIWEHTLLTLTVVIGGTYCSYCDSGNRVRTSGTVMLVIGGAYRCYCHSGDTGCLLY